MDALVTFAKQYLITKNRVGQKSFNQLKILLDKAVSPNIAFLDSDKSKHEVQVFGEIRIKKTLANYRIL